ncbi:MAG: NAD(+)/NADH kinase [Firmicutes bacterium]|nr:NAD(+)/NADH kinase [Bacillota bacterium]
MDTIRRMHLITNSIKDPEGEFAAAVIEFAVRNGVSVSTDEIGEDTDCVLVLGGDGTVLRASALSTCRGIPILGINLGTLGYLAEIDKRDWKSALSRVFSGEYEVEDRMLLEARKAGGGPDSGSDMPALNDIVFSRKGPLRIMSYDIFVGGEPLYSFKADGVIVSTPTGSTAYNLSAGGPIVEPSARMILLTPICPHTLTSRPIVLSAEDVISVRIGGDLGDGIPVAEAAIDGEKELPLVCGDVVNIRSSDRVAKLIRLGKRSFLETLHRKMTN